MCDSDATIIERLALITSIRLLRDALHPFAALLHKSMDSRPGGDASPVYGIGDAVFTVGDLRRAAEALLKTIKYDQPPPHFMFGDPDHV